MEDRALLRQIDCCRPDGRDLDQPELAELAARAVEDPRVAELLARGRAFDRRVAAALDQAPVPAGLEGRLLAALAAAETEAELGAEASHGSKGAPAREASPPPAPAATSPTVLPLVGPRRSTRRRLAIRAAIAATVAFLAFGTAWLWPRGFSPQEVKTLALEFYQQDDPQLSGHAPPDYPPSGQIVWSGRPVPRRADGFLGCSAVAFDLQRGGVRATLYVAPLSVAGLPTSPPSRLGPTTGRQAVVAWQEGDLLYVLVVEGGEREYRQFMPAQTIA